MPGGRLRVLLVGNYEPDEQQSMQRYGEWMQRSLLARGCVVTMLKPPVAFSRLATGPFRRPAVVKYLGYIDKYVLFPSRLRALIRKSDLVHICDHSNAMYLAATAGVPTVITCHDLLAVRSARGEFTSTRTGWSGRRLQDWILGSLRKASNVIAVSTRTSEDFRRLTGNTEARVAVIPNALNWPYKPRAEFPESLRKRIGRGLEGGYFLHVGGNQWYKNRPAVVRIFAALSGMEEFKSTCLVMAGKAMPAALRKTVEESGLSDRVVSLIGSTNEELEALYSHGQALIFPSLEEGFGWPIAEAQACGCPVAVTGRAPMTEVAGGAAIYFDPADPVAAADAIRDGLRKRAELREAGLRNVARFEEARIIEEYLSFYATVLAG